MRVLQGRCRFTMRFATASADGCRLGIELAKPALPAHLMDEQGASLAWARCEHALGLQADQQGAAERAAEMPATLGPGEARLHARRLYATAFDPEPPEAL